MREGVPYDIVTLYPYKLTKACMCSVYCMHVFNSLHACTGNRVNLF